MVSYCTSCWVRCLAQCGNGGFNTLSLLLYYYQEVVATNGGQKPLNIVAPCDHLLSIDVCIVNGDLHIHLHNHSGHAATIVSRQGQS